jgi:hypothetical protein
VVEIKGFTRGDVATATGAERLPGVDKPLHASSLLLVFPAIAVQSGATFGHLSKILP